MKILISAGPTREAIDPVRYISNHSSGKMGYALAEAAIQAGHQVSLISGPVRLTPPDGLQNYIPVLSAAEMADAVKSYFPSSDALIMCAAVADYRPKRISSDKIKKSEGNLILELERTEDILQSVGKIRTPSQILVGFAAETDHLREYALSKLQRKNLDWIAANQIGLPDRGFQSDENAVTLYGVSGEIIELPLLPKKELAKQMIQLLFHDK